MEISFLAGEVAKAAGIPKPTLQMWLWRGDIPIPAGHIQGGEGTGNHRRFSLAALMQIVVGCELMKFRLPHTDALRAAARFAYSTKVEDDGTWRCAGFPFHPLNGRSFLLVPAGHPEKAVTVLVKDNALPLWAVPSLAGCFAALDVTATFERTFKGLGLDPIKALNDVYPNAMARA